MPESPLVRYVPVAGTWDWRAVGVSSNPDWYEQGSPFHQYMLARDYEHLHPQRPFIWSTDLAGISWAWLNKLVSKRTGHESWAAAGYNLFQYMAGTPHRHRNVISHSHGLQPVLFAAAAGCKIHVLIDFSGPHRHDLKPIIERALPNIETWVHVYGDWRDYMQWFGGVFDGHLGIKRAFKYPGIVNIKVEDTGHSSMLTDARNFPQTYRILNDYLRGQLHGV